MPRLEHVRAAVPPREVRNPFTGQMQTAPGRPEQRTIFEIELRGPTIETCLLREGKRPKHAVTRYATPAIAERAYQGMVERKLAAKYVDRGRPQLLAPSAPSGAGSTLLTGELFEAGDARFVDELLACDADKKLTSFAAPWIADPRREMRAQLLAYVDDGCDRWFHKGLVKHLFKAAEKNGDDELMAHFMVAFDRIVRRYPVERTAWLGGGRWAKEVVLFSDPLVPERLTEKQSSPRFTRATRRYLARRAFRYFRKIGRTDRARYGRAMRTALALYQDEHLDTPVRLLDSWALLHVLYAWSPVLERNPRGIRVVKGRSLGELSPAPYFESAWTNALPELLELLAAARCRTVRRWAIAWLEERYAPALEGLDVSALRSLVTHADGDVARFGAKLLRRAVGLERLAIADWLALLRTENVDVAPIVVEAFERSVSPKRLTLAQAAELTAARVASVAELGLRWLIEKKPASGEDLATVARVADATVDHVRIDGSRFLLSLLEASPELGPRHLRDLFDSRFADVRALAKSYLEAKKIADVPLWFALLESPYDDVRALVVRHVEEWQGLAGIGEIEHLASTVLLAVHRGAATKQSMLRRIADRAAARPEEADRLLPVLSVALRSVRPPERVGALAALTRAAIAHDSLREAVSRHLPELRISDQVAR